MGTFVRPAPCARALLLAAASLTACGDGAATRSPTSPREEVDPSPSTDPEPGDPLDPTQTQGTDLPVASRAFLNFPELAAEAAESPLLLSQTGAFESLSTLEVSEGLLPYGVQAPLWSDGAHKRRWLSLPADGKIGFSATGQWSFPEGTVFVKHFAMALDETRPNELRDLETRFWIAARGGEFYGLVYKWNEDQSDAQLLLEGATEELSILGGDGTTRAQTYSYPSTTACRNCHSQAAGPVRGVNTRQLNGDYDYAAARRGASEPAGSDAGSLGGDPPVLVNQLATLDALGLFEAPIGDPAQYGQLSPLGDAAAPLVDRVRSYWDSNCSMCHYGAGSPSWDARYATPLAEQMLIMAEPLVGPGSEDLRLILPQEPDRSYVYLRGNSATPGVRMPPILKNRVDAGYVSLLRQWILSLDKQ